MDTLLSRWRETPLRTWILYAILYATVGLMNQRLGQHWHIAEFRHDWQVLTCYVLYLVPWSLAVRRFGPADQFVWGMLCLALIEIPGYAIGSSIAHPGNLLDQWFGERNFTLLMTVGFAAFLPAGNLVVARLEQLLGWSEPTRASRGATVQAGGESA